jgi:hypothetical protein
MIWGGKIEGEEDEVRAKEMRSCLESDAISRVLWSGLVLRTAAWTTSRRKNQSINSST